ncbi:MAG: hypothetical protein E7646_06050 [Ruminococcaceae bacterium]|nr:hypothetical protein [Oscillospiraceae bacterium]
MHHTYLVPDYFENFKCKMGACRHACCEGWRVSVDMAKYFELIGADCSPELRRRIDCSLRLSDCPSEDSYAYIEHGYDGNCRLRSEDGSCSLQNALGEGAIPDVCRLYPRGIRKDDYGLECSLSNSCEATLELLLHRSEPISFSEKASELQPPKKLRPVHTIDSFGIQLPLRLFFISILQERELSLPQRLTKLKNVFLRLEKCSEENDRITPQKIVSGSLFFLPDPGLEPDPQSAATVLELMKLLCSHSDSLSEAALPIIEGLEKASEPERLYLCLKERFENGLKDWQIFFEHMLVNHVFFSRFPFQDRPHSAMEEHLALCTVYLILRFICIGGCLDGFDEAKTVDLCADAFRLIDHTDFESFAIRAVKSLLDKNTQALEALITL